MDLGLEDILDPVFNSGGHWLDNEVPSESYNDDIPELEEHIPLEEDSRVEQTDNTPVMPSNIGIETLLTGLDFVDSLTSATADVGVSSPFVQPWERGPMNQLFAKSAGIDALPKGLNAFAGEWQRQPSLVAMETAEVAKPKHSKQPLVPSFLHVVCNVRDVDFLENRKASMKVAVDKFCKLILMNPKGFELGSHLTVDMSDQEQEKDILDWLEAAFSMKAPSTVNKRASALLLYATFVYDYGSGKPFPVSSGEVVKYFQLLKESGRYVSRASSLREALRFAHYTVGLKGALSACDDVRAKALSEAMMLQGPEWCPADPLTVLEVRIFHAIMEDESQPDLDRFAAGCTLMMIYGRCRASDLCHIQKIIYDFSSSGDGTGYLELQTKFHKTARRSGQRAKLLPIVAPSVGIDGKPWALKFKGLREKLGLCDTGENFPFWPALLEIRDGKVLWSKRPLMSTEVSRWLVTALDIPETSKRSISSHSCKATCLSWMSKIGATKEVRDILGRHVSALEGAGPLYSRDLLSSPLRQLDETIDLIRRSVFMPDHTRSGMLLKSNREDASSASLFPTKRPKLENNVVIEVKDDLPLEADENIDSSETSEAESYSSSVDVVAERVDPNNVVHLLDVKEDEEFFKHKRTKVVHIVSPDCRVDDTKLFNCGRSLNGNYMCAPFVIGVDLKCSSCFKGKRFVPEDQIPQSLDNSQA